MEMERKAGFGDKDRLQQPISLHTVGRRKAWATSLPRKLTFLPHFLPTKQGSLPIKVVGRCYIKGKSQLFPTSPSNLRNRLKALQMPANCAEKRSTSECKLLPQNCSFTVLDVESQTSWLPRKLSLPFTKSPLSTLLERPYAWLLAKTPVESQMSMEVQEKMGKRGRSLPRLRLKRAMQAKTSAFGPWLSRTSSRPDTSQWMLAKVS